MGKNGKPKAQHQQPAGQHAQFERIPGTAIKMLKGGIPVRVVHASGKEFHPNNVQAAWKAVERQGHDGGGERSQRKGKGKGVIKTHVKQAKGGGGKGQHGKGQNGKGQNGKGQAKGQTKGQAKGQTKSQGKIQKQQKGGGKGQVQKTGKGGGKGKGGKAVQAPVKFKQGGFAATMVKKKNLKNGKGAGKGGKGRKGQKGQKKKKKMTPEQEAAYKEKRAEKHATKIEKEMRMLANETYYTGEIVATGRFFCWVLPQSPPIPASVMPELKKMNDEFRAKCAQNTDGKKARPFANGCEGNVVYVARDDIEEEALEPEVGTAVRFKLYTDSKGVGGCEVVSA